MAASVDIKSLIGRMNLDDSNYNIGRGEHKYANNVRFIGDAGNMQVQNALGNVLIPNNYLPSGTNQTVGAFYDQVGKRIIFFNWNSNGRNGIYQYSTALKTLTKIFLCFTDTATDILLFNRDYPVHSASIVYRTTEDGDLLYWTDGYNRPRYLNLDTVSTLQPFTEDMINAGKNAPLAPPTVAFADNATVNVNNFRKKIFRGCYNWVYASGEESTFSPISKEAFTSTGYAVNTNNDPTKNNNIQIGVIAGGDDSVAIKVYGQFNEDNSWGDFFEIDRLDLTDYGISPGGGFAYSFYNNGAYPFIDPAKSNLYFSWLPDKANTLELLNGNVIIYAGITEGYDQLQRSDVDVTVTVGLSAPNIPTISYAYTGAHELSLFIGSVITPGAVYSVFFIYSSGAGGDASPKNITYTTLGGDTQNTVAIAIAAALSGNNISATNLGAGNVRVITTTGAGSITNVIVSVNVGGAEVAAQSWKPSCPGRLGLVYFDDRGKTNGVISFVGDAADTTDFAFTTPDFGTNNNVIQVPTVSASINHTPPTWATCFQWVRANLLPTKFLYWVTNDYYAETNYLYFGIENLVDQNISTSGFVPSYSFTPGDRIRVIASYPGGGNFTTYNLQLDMEVLGTVQKTMHTPATLGLFLKVATPTAFPSAPYVSHMLVEIYTPKEQVPNELQVFYEWGEKYNIYTSGGDRYHRGQISDQTASQPATFQWFDGDVYFKPRIFQYEASPTLTNFTEYFFDANYSDYFKSAVNSNGRTWPIDLSAKQRYNGVQLRWGGKYQQDTDINSLNIFQPLDLDTVDLSKGDIWRLKARDRELRIFQDRGVGRTGIYSKYIQDSGSTSVLTTTSEIITPNNIQYYQGEYGLAGYPTSLVSTESVDYFSDPVRGVQVRLSGDGFTAISTLYKGEYTLKDYLTPYGQDVLRADNTRAKIMGWFDYFWNDYVMVLQAGSANSKNYPARTLAFNEDDNAYMNFYDIFPDWAIDAEATNYQFLGGNLWIQNNAAKYCNYFNHQYYPSITIPFNDKIAVKKTYEALAYQANQHWVSDTNGDILTSQPNPQTNLPQISQLKQVDFTIEEGLYYASFLRDANSMTDAREALVNGDFLKGVWMQCKLTYKGSDFATLYLPYISYEISPRNL